MEFMPLSKRINNLHINNSFLLKHSIGELSSIKEGASGSTQYINQLPEFPSGSEGGIEWNVSPEYAPDLYENENPHYFGVNKLLFEMYLQRLQRGCHQI